MVMKQETKLLLFKIYLCFAVASAMIWWTVYIIVRLWGN